MSTPTKHQLLALRLASPTGYLRRLTGGYWVDSEVRGPLVPSDDSMHVGTTTVMACHNRGWLEAGERLARLTDVGRAMAAQIAARQKQDGGQG